MSRPSNGIAVLLAVAALAVSAPALAGSGDSAAQAAERARQLRQQQLDLEVQNSMRNRELYNAQQQIYRQQDRQNVMQNGLQRPEVPAVRQPCQLGARGIATGGC